MKNFFYKKTLGAGLDCILWQWLDCEKKWALHSRIQLYLKVDVFGDGLTLSLRTSQQKSKPASDLDFNWYSFTKTNHVCFQTTAKSSEALKGSGLHVSTSPLWLHSVPFRGIKRRNESVTVYSMSLMLQTTLRVSKHYVWFTPV